MEVERSEIVALHGGADAREGLRAFMENRTPNFQ
jgi:hypothetical protein